MSSVKAFYDGFSHKFLRDYVHGNLRIDRQLDFFARAIHRTCKSILVIGCGSGEGAHFIATRVAPQAQVLGLDLSRDALEAGRKLFAHPRLELREADVFATTLEKGPFEIIAFPDSYEHLPLARRGELGTRLKGWLAPGGRILLTIPTPAEQRQVVERNNDVQPIDEPVTLEDLATLAQAVEGKVTYFNMISVWQTNDYAHAVVERASDELRRIADPDRIPLKIGEAPGLTAKWQGKLQRRWRKNKLSRL